MFGSLRLRLALLISLAVLPLGLIAVQQSLRVTQDARDLEEQDILFRTVQAASSEQEIFREAFGAATAIGAAALEIGPGSAACDAVMARLAAMGPYVFAGFISSDGLLTCSHDGSRIDFSTGENWQAFVADPRERLTVNRSGPVSRQSVVVATIPLFDTATQEFLGAASVSIPHTVADWLLDAPVDGLRIALVGRDGQVLTASEGIDAAFVFDAFGIVPGDLEMDQSGTTQVVTAADGQERLVAVAPVFGREVFVMGIWENDASPQAGPRLGWLAPAFPILMWIAALVVSMFALERLVLRHLRHLRGRMRRFSPDDPANLLAELDHAPAEIAEIAESYNRMVGRIVTDRDVLSRNVSEKELLLREVHHRVKNNLQLIASILNMQIRGLSSPREQALLRRVQSRVMSLSTVHRALYEGNHVGPVRADRLLRTVLDATFQGALPGDGRVATKIAFDEIILDADQAVPLVLLAAEATTNAIKFVGRPIDGLASIAVSLRLSDDGRITLTVANSTGPRLIEPAEPTISGLGSRLIEGFSAQLGASVETRNEDGLRILEVAFHPIGTAPEPMAAEGLSFYGATRQSRAGGG
jgi:two-component sensor histidine kinase